MSFDAWQTSAVGVLPELPRSTVSYILHVVMGNPVGIFVKLWAVQILLLKLSVGIYYRGASVSFFADVEPCLGLAAYLVSRQRACTFYVQNRRQVALPQMHLTEIKLCLRNSCSSARIEEMVNPTYKVTATSLPEVTTVTPIHHSASLGALHHHEANGIASESCLRKLFPVDYSLMVTNIYSMDAIALRQFHLTVARLPHHVVGLHDEVPAQIGIDCHCR